MISGFLFISWRIAELLFVVPIVGMLGWFVHGYSSSNQLTPTSVLVLFIVACLALAWVLLTLLGYSTARHSGLFLSFVDLSFVGAFIAGVYCLRAIAAANCSNFSSASFYLDLGVFGYFGRNSDSPWAADINKNCAMLKASFALAIVEILLFAATSFLALCVARHHRNDEKVVVTTRRTSHRAEHRSSSRSRSGYVSHSPRRSHHSHRSRRSYYV